MDMAVLENRWIRHEARREVGFLLHNFVAAAKSLIDHSRAVYRHLYKPKGLIPDYQAEIDRRFLSDPLSRFVVDLRRMAQHYRLPSISITHHFENIGSDTKVDTRLVLSVADLGTFQEWTAPASGYLDRAGKDIDISTLARNYYDHVIAFYGWFRTEQKKVHGETPAVYAYLTKHGPHSDSDRILAQIADNVAQIERKPRERLTFADMFNVLAPAFTILDQRILMLCQHSPQVWLREALALIESRFTLPLAVRNRLEAMTPPGASRQTGRKCPS